MTMTQEQTWTWTFEEQIPSDAAQGVRIIQELLARLAEHCWTDNELFGVHLALEEAVMNAIRHGNKCDLTKSVNVVAKISPSRFYIRVTDQGAGFDPEALPDPTADENLDKPSGRGVMLMRIYMSSVEYNAAGNSVEMLKTRDPS